MKRKTVVLTEKYVIVFCTLESVQELSVECRTLNTPKERHLGEVAELMHSC